MNMECAHGDNPVDVFGGKESVFQFILVARITNVMVAKEVSGGRFSNHGRSGCNHGRIEVQTKTLWKGRLLAFESKFGKCH